MIYGTETWTLDAVTKRALNGANSKMVSAITGRTPPEEAAVEKTYDIIAGVRATRLRWLGKILLMIEDRMVLKAVKILYENPKEGHLLMDDPVTKTWEELREKVKDTKEGALAVRAIKDEIHIRKQGKRKGKRRGHNRKKKKKEMMTKTSTRVNNREKGRRRQTEEGEDGDESEQEDNSSDGGRKPRNRASHKPTRPQIRFYDQF